MTRARLQISMDEGWRVDLLFTPHLYSYRGTGGVTLALPSDELSEEDKMRETMSLYCDVFYLAALNAWELDEHEGEPPFKRGDFHEWATLHPRAFGKAMAQCVEALTGKPLNAAQTDTKGEGGADTHTDGEGAADVKKKPSSVKNGPRWRRFFLGR